ncbi:MAG: hypothetical protein OEN01_04275 [Candidatus Krumholzibacteria bacterium]|nr:hypothetical protein [Candidatus Krumholzibacteria bacterium]
MRDNTLKAYFAINGNKREFPKLQRLIRRRVDVTGKDEELQNPSFDLKSFF